MHLQYLQVNSKILIIEKCSKYQGSDKFWGLIIFILISLIYLIISSYETNTVQFIIIIDVLNNWLINLLKISQSTLSSQYKPNLEHHQLNGVHARDKGPQEKLCVSQGLEQKKPATSYSFSSGALWYSVNISHFLHPFSLSSHLKSSALLVQTWFPYLERRWVLLH